MQEKTIIYGITVFGLLFVPESRAKELADGNNALLAAKTWGEFKSLVSKELYEFYLPNSDYYQGPKEPEDGNFDPYDIPPEIPFTPNDVVMDDVLPANPEIEMSEWMPEEIQEKFGRKMRYATMDMNVPEGEILVLEEKQMDEIVAALEKLGFVCKRDDDLLMAGTTLDFDPDDYPLALPVMDADYGTLPDDPHRLTYEQWAAKYKVVNAVDTPIKDEDFENHVNKVGANHFWTKIIWEDDFGGWGYQILSGFHRVNRDCYLETEVPWNEDTSDYAEWYEELADEDCDDQDEDEVDEGDE